VTTGSLIRTVIMVLAAGLWSCGQAGDYERRGDQAYGDGNYSVALTEYRTAVAADPDARIWAKIGAAALRTGNLDAASDAYLRLAAEDPTRAEEAAEGLEGVARAAERSRDAKHLESAVIGLGMIAPNRSIGRYALAVVRQPGAQANDLVAVLPAAIAAAPDAEAMPLPYGKPRAVTRRSGYFKPRSGALARTDCAPGPKTAWLDAPWHWDSAPKRRERPTMPCSGLPQPSGSTPVLQWAAVRWWATGTHVFVRAIPRRLLKPIRP
jgi:hypothetical protein